MTPLSPDALLSGPRGRRLCFHLVSTQLPWYAHDNSSDQPIHDVVSAWQGVTLPAITGEVLTLALADAATTGRYWQPPDETDVLLARPEMAEALHRIAQHVCHQVPAWWTEMARDLVRVDFEGVPKPGPPDMLAWGVVSGAWWMTPGTGSGVLTRMLPGIGPLGAYLVEDPMDWPTAEVFPATPTPRSVLELDEAVLVDLCREHPIDVTLSKRGDWYRATGLDTTWVIPDWSRVAADWDAVHLPITTWLACAGRPLIVREGVHTLIAGWNPDATFLLRGVVTLGSAGRWARDHDSRGWVPAITTLSD